MTSFVIIAEVKESFVTKIATSQALKDTVVYSNSGTYLDLRKVYATTRHKRFKWRVGGGVGEMGEGVPPAALEPYKIGFQNCASAFWAFFLH